MAMNKKISGISAGVRYGLQGILITMLCLPALLLVTFNLDALRDNVEHWDPQRISLELYYMAPIIGLVFFSIPYLLGSYILGRLLEKTFLTTKWLSIMVGIVSGLLGISL